MWVLSEDELTTDGEDDDQESDAPYSDEETEGAMTEMAITNPSPPIVT
jgi:hypothetical protein